jgi:uncharacterized repeat protein (TIGR04138 family)
MQNLQFSEAVEILVDRDSRYHREAYVFLRDALDHAMKLRKRSVGEAGHVTGQQLLEAVRQVALKQFGPMAPTVFEYWGLRSGEDFGHMVFQLVDSGVFGKTDSDSIEDFRGGYTFHEAFVVPFLPENFEVAPELGSGAERAEALPAQASS